MSLDLAIKSLDELEKEIDTVIRAEFSEYGDRLDEVIMLIRTTDRTDVARLTSQMGRMQAIMERGTQCTCEPEKRWHACLGRLSVALGSAAMRFNVENVKLFCESMGISFDEVLGTLKMLSPQEGGELPDLPTDINIPNDLRDLT